MLKAILSVVLVFTAMFSSFKARLTPAGSAPDGGVRVRYGSGVCEYYDMYLPDETDGEVNVVFAVHGGSWMSGDQTMFTGHAREAAEYGAVGVTVDYDKILNNATCADMVDELFAAVGSVKAKLEELGVTPGRMIVAGHSSGSHLALLYAYTHYADSPLDIAFVVGVSSPTELYKDFGSGTTIEGSRDLLLTALTRENINARTAEEYAAAIAAVCPYDLVTADVPPTLLIHGDADSVVPYGNSVDLYERLTELGVDTELVTLEGVNHFLGIRGPSTQKIYDSILAWAQRYLH